MNRFEQREQARKEATAESGTVKVHIDRNPYKSDAQKKAMKIETGGQKLGADGKMPAISHGRASNHRQINTGLAWQGLTPQEIPQKESAVVTQEQAVERRAQRRDQTDE